MEYVEPGQLSELERVLLAVLAAGLAPAALARDSSFRLDVVTGRILALLHGETDQRYLGSGGQATPQFQAELTAAIHGLTDRHILMAGGAGATAFVGLDGLDGAPATPAAAPIDFDSFPALADRYLAGRCLDDLLRNSAAYRYIMDKYAESSEIWQRSARQGF